MKQIFFNLEIETKGQNLYEFTSQSIKWVEKNRFSEGI